MRLERAEGDDQYCDGACSAAVILRTAGKEGALRAQHMHRLQASEKQTNDIGYEPALKAEIDRWNRMRIHDCERCSWRPGARRGLDI